jgi:YD repeat-containing protein
MNLLSRIGLGLVVAALAAAPAFAQEKETRTYAVTVDGKEAGSAKVVATTQADGTTDLSSATDVKVRVPVLGTFTSSYQGVERWKDGKLVSLDASGDDNGAKTRVTAARDGDRLGVDAGKGKRAAAGDAVPNTFWALPPAAAAAGKVTVLETDTGKEVAATVQTVGNATATVGGKGVACTHYRVTAGKQVYDLHYDAQGRLVRQEFTQQGYKTVFALTGTGR